MQHVLPTVRIDRASRLAVQRLDKSVRREAHRSLDRAFNAYRVELERFDEGRPELPARAIESIRHEARALVELRYDNESAHELYMSSRKPIRITPACQSDDCDNCHRVLALVNMRGLCETRSEYRALMNWIMDPGFLA